MLIAQLIAEAVAVVCPTCGGSQPNQNGSLMWTYDDFKKNSGPRRCVECDEKLTIHVTSKVQFTE